jgi:hypothetical protein
MTDQVVVKSARRVRHIVMGLDFNEAPTEHESHGLSPFSFRNSSAQW